MDKVQNTSNPRFYLKRFTSYFAFGFLYILLIIFFTSCQDNQGDIITSSAGENNLSAGFFSAAGGDNSLQLTEAKFVLRKLVLEQENSENESEIKLGPFIIHLDMGLKVVTAGIAKLPFGAYDEVKFQVHKPTPNDGITDPDFIESNSRRYSVVVRGYYNTIPFTYKTDLTVAKEIEFEGAPVSIGAVPLVYITIKLDPYSWFWVDGIYLDPSDENNRHLIDQNIKQSLRRAFRDMDQNGEPD